MSHDSQVNKTAVDIIDRFVRRRESVFLTGAAGATSLILRRLTTSAAYGPTGTGKSVLLQSIVSILRQDHRLEPDAIAVTATTGCAAAELGGTTLHSWAGLPPNLANTENVVAKIRFRKGVAQRWKSVKILIIDEVSMLSGRTFQQLSEIACAIRCKSFLPFGGITLPPVQKNALPYFAFQSSAWKLLFQPRNSVVLATIYRQTTAGTLWLLIMFWIGVLTDHAVHLLKSVSRSLPPSITEPVNLFARRQDVDSANQASQQRLTSPTFTFTSRDSASRTLSQPKSLFNAMIAPSILSLRTGSQVMLIRNIDVSCGLVSGTTGKVIGFHRIDEVSSHANATSTTAIRAVSLGAEGTPLAPDPSSAPLHQDDDTRYPLVSFPLDGGDRREAVLLMQHEFRIDDAQGRSLARRHQIPLILAWALSIHRSQGKTLSRVIVNMENIYQCGQAYVALSRCSSLEGLQVVGFHPLRVKTHPDVVAFYKSLGNDTHPVYGVLSTDFASEIPWDSWQNLEELRLPTCLYHIGDLHRCRHEDGPWRDRQRVVVQEEISETFDPEEEASRDPDAWVCHPEPWLVPDCRGPRMEVRILRPQETVLRAPQSDLTALRRLTTHPCLLERFMVRAPVVTYLRIDERSGCPTFNTLPFTESHFSSVNHVVFSRVTFRYLLRLAPHFTRMSHAEVHDSEHYRFDDLTMALAAFPSPATILASVKVFSVASSVSAWVHPALVRAATGSERTQTPLTPLGVC
ncbi:hypothetical protein ONZ45_g14265 [Pleurotus djamor]|nr:hypothetical protein ONZ45_g14265 [Pleurotus djamor]